MRESPARNRGKDTPRVSPGSASCPIPRTANWREDIWCSYEVSRARRAIRSVAYGVEFACIAGRAIGSLATWRPAWSYPMRQSAVLRGRSTWKHPSVKANGNGPGSLVRYSPSKNTIARSRFCWSNWKDGFHGPECHPRSSAVMIWIGELHSESAREGRSALHHHKPVSGGNAPLPTQTRAKIASNPTPL